MRGRDWLALGDFVAYFGRDGMSHLAEVLGCDHGVFRLRLRSGAALFVHHRYITPHLTPREEALVAARRQAGSSQATAA